MKSLFLWCAAMLFGFLCWSTGAATICEIETLKERGTNVTRGLVASEFGMDFIFIGLFAALIAVAYWTTETE